MTQYVACKFRAGERRSYTYANNGAPLAVGDKAKVPAARGEDGFQVVEVVAVDQDKPSFACKEVIGKVEPDQPSLAVG